MYVRGPEKYENRKYLETGYGIQCISREK